MKYCLVKYPVSGNIYLATRSDSGCVVLQSVFLAGQKSPLPPNYFPYEVPIGTLNSFILCESEDIDGQGNS